MIVHCKGCSQRTVWKILLQIWLSSLYAFQHYLKGVVSLDPLSVLARYATHTLWNIWVVGCDASFITSSDTSDSSSELHGHFHLKKTRYSENNVLHLQVYHKMHPWAIGLKHQSLTQSFCIMLFGKAWIHTATNVFADIILRRSCSLFWKWYFDQIHKISDPSYTF